MHVALVMCGMCAIKFLFVFGGRLCILLQF